MRKARRNQRILFLLLLLSFSVIVPIFLVSSRLKNLSSSSTGQRELIEDVSAIKYRTESLRLSAVEQETSGDLKEPDLIVYKDESFDPRLSYGSSEKIDLKKVDNDGTRETTDLPLIVESATNIIRNEEIQHTNSPSMLYNKTAGTDVLSNQTKVHGRKFQPRPRKSTNVKVKELKDQLIRSRVYLNLAPPGKNIHLVKDLRLKMKELERAAGEATKDSELSRSALQKSRAMEAVLSKAHRVYPDCSAMAIKLRAMNGNAEEQVQAQKNQVSYLVKLAARTTPKGLHCLTMRLTAEYFALRPEERQLPNQQKLTDPNLYHYAVFSDNVLATAVVVNSTVSAALEPEKVVFHVVTDSLNLAAVSMWFLLNPPGSATIEVQSIENFEWLSKNNITVKDYSHDPRYTSSLNHLRFYLPNVFPALQKVVFFDHDVVIQSDLTALWRTNMKGKVIGAVETCQEGESSFHQMQKFINFSDPFVAERFDAKACTWAFGMNLIDLQEWRKQKLTDLYQRYLHMGYDYPLWKAGTLPLGWVTFYNKTVALDRRWHILGLGYESEIGQGEIERAAVIHYDGVMKPWLEIGIGKYKVYWSRHVNYANPTLQQCNIHE